MHAEVYKARPDVCAVIHGHPTYGTALGATTADLAFLTHDAVLFTDGLGIYDDGPSLVTEPGQGRAVAAALGTRRAALRGWSRPNPLTPTTWPGTSPLQCQARCITAR